MEGPKETFGCDMLLNYGDCLMAIHICQNLLYTLNIYSLLYLYLNKTVFKK